MANDDRTEPATPKKKEEARKKGQVAKSTDLSGAAVVLAGLFAIGATGPAMVQRMSDGIHDSLAAGAKRDPVTVQTISDLLLHSGSNAAWCLAPIVGACMLVGIVVNLAQVGIRLKSKALKPDFKRLNPKTGFKKVAGKQSLVELGKNLLKISIVLYVVLSALLPHITDYAAMVGMSPWQLGGSVFTRVKSISFRPTSSSLAIGIVDYFY